MKNQEFKHRINGIAEIGNWRADFGEENEFRYNQATIIMEDEKMRFFIRAGNEPCNYGKFHISSLYPRHSNGDILFSTPHISINVSMNKTDERIVKEINRRFMPEYKLLYGMVISQIRERDNLVEQKESILNRMKSILPEADVRDNDPIYAVVYFKGGSIEITGNEYGNAKLELNTSPSMMTAIADFIINAKPGDAICSLPAEALKTLPMDVLEKMNRITTVHEPHKDDSSFYKHPVFYRQKNRFGAIGERGAIYFSGVNSKVAPTICDACGGTGSIFESKKENGVSFLTGFEIDCPKCKGKGFL